MQIFNHFFFKKNKKRFPTCTGTFRADGLSLSLKTELQKFVP